jgi:RNA polymerase sigma factor (sigma-70 family)
VATTPLQSTLRLVHRLAGGADLDDLTDRQLLERFARPERDEAAFAAVVRRHGPLVLGVARRVLRHDQDAEDVLQATFLVLARRARSGRWRDSVGNWLYGVAYRLAIEATSRSFRQRERERMVTAASQAGRALEGLQELYLALDEELQRLPRSYRQPLLLCYLEGRTRDQAARHLGLSVRTLHRRLERGLRLLRARLARRGVELPAALLAAGLSQQAASAGVSAVVERSVLAAVAGGTAGAAGMSAKAVALAEAGLKGIGVARGKIALALVLVAGVLVAGVGIVLGGVPAGMQAAALPAGGLEQPPPGPAPRAPAGREGRALPEGAIGRLGGPDSSGDVFCVAVAPDGKVIATAGWDGVIRLWDPATGTERRRLAGHDFGVFSVAFSPDSRALASGGRDRTIRVWAVATGKELRRLAGHEGPVNFVAFSPDGKMIASKSNDGTLRLWDIATGREQRRLGRPDGKSRFHEPKCSLAFSPDSRTVASASGVEGEFPNHRGRTLSMWDVTSGEELRRFVGQRPSFGAVALSPDGKTLVSGSLNELSLRRWDSLTGKALDPLEIAETEVTSLVFSPDGRSLAWRGHNESIHVWDVVSGREYRVFQGADSGRGSLAFYPNSRVLASAGAGAGVLLWDLTGRSPDGKLRACHRAPAEIQLLWESLKQAEVAKARDALWQMVAAPGQAVPFLAEHLRPVVAADPKRIDQWIRNLESEQFAVRERAARELGAQAEAAAPALRRALRGQPSAELRRRVRGLLADLEEVSSESLRRWRAVEVLEQVGSSEARQVLQALAGGAPEVRLTREAKAALERLARRSASMP